MLQRRYNPPMQCSDLNRTRRGRAAATLLVLSCLSGCATVSTANMIPTEVEIVNRVDGDVAITAIGGVDPTFGGMEEVPIDSFEAALRESVATFGPFAQVWPRSAGLGPYPYGGGGASIQAATPSPSDPFATRVVATARFAVDLAAPGQALASIAPGQSEHPGHAHFRDGVPRWLEGRLGLLPTSRLLIDENRVARLVLEPVR